MRHVRPLAIAATVAGALGGCGESHYLVVTIDGPAAVHDVATLRVALANAGSMRTDEFALGGRALPVTFAISSPDRAGALDVAVDALDGDGLVVGHGSASATFTDDAARVTLATTDFVVDTTYAGDQLLSDDYNGYGNQLAATPDGTWIATFRDNCASAPCNLLARRFDHAGRPLVSMAAASAQAFALTAEVTKVSANPTAAAAGTAFATAWNFTSADGLATGVACRAVDATGATPADPVMLGAEAADVVVATQVTTTANAAIAWTVTGSPTRIVSQIVDRTCTPIGAPATIATAAASTFYQVPVVGAATDGHLLYAWIDGDNVDARATTATNVPVGGGITLVPATATDRAVYARVVPFGAGFGVLVRWVPKSGTGAGRIDLHPVATTGVPTADPITLVTDQSGGDFATVDAFGAAADPSAATILVVWHGCDAAGDGNGCGVWGRFVRATGVVGDAFGIPTTTIGDQKGPSAAYVGDAFVVAWNDFSAQPPDTAGAAVRARVVYPPP